MSLHIPSQQSYHEIYLPVIHKNTEINLATIEQNEI